MKTATGTSIRPTTISPASGARPRQSSQGLSPCARVSATINAIRTTVSVRDRSEHEGERELIPDSRGDADRGEDAGNQQLGGQARAQEDFEQRQQPLLPRGELLAERLQLNWRDRFDFGARVISQGFQSTVDRRTV